MFMFKHVQKTCCKFADMQHTGGDVTDLLQQIHDRFFIRYTVTLCDHRSQALGEWVSI